MSAEDLIERTMLRQQEFYRQQVDAQRRFFVREKESLLAAQRDMLAEQRKRRLAFEVAKARDQTTFAGLCTAGLGVGAAVDHFVHKRPANRFALPLVAVAAATMYLADYGWGRKVGRLAEKSDSIASSAQFE